MGRILAASSVIHSFVSLLRTIPSRGGCESSSVGTSGDMESGRLEGEVSAAGEEKPDSGMAGSGAASLWAHEVSNINMAKKNISSLVCLIMNLL